MAKKLESLFEKVNDMYGGEPISLVDLDTNDTMTITLDDDGHASSVDMVNAPPHYVIADGLEWIDVREALAKKLMKEGVVLPYEDYSDWDRALEYLVRGPWKNGKEDYDKALFYLRRLIKRMEDREDFLYES